MKKVTLQKLGEVADIKLSNVDKKTNENERPVRLCNYTDVYKNSFINFEKSKNFMVASCNDNEYEKFLLKKGQVAITKDSETRNDIGVSTYISDDFEDVVLGYHLSLITPDDKKLNGEFLHYWFNSKQAKIYFENNAGGSGQRCTLTLDCIKSIPLSLPDLPTQKLIASVLSTFDSKIELNNKINSELEAMAKIIYDYWFVQFDFPYDFKNKKPDLNGKPYRSSGGKMVWSEELKREIPEGWEVGTLGEILTTKLGGTPSTKNKLFWENGNIHWLNSGEIANFPIISSELKITNEGLKKSATTLLPKGTTLLSITRHLRPTVLAIDACANQSVIGIMEKDDLKFSYIYPYIKNEIPRYMSLRTGAQQPHINKDIVDESFILVPDSIFLKGYNEIVIPLYNKIFINAFENQSLSSLRDWLLPMLMNGQVKVE